MLNEINEMIIEYNAQINDHPDDDEHGGESNTSYFLNSTSSSGTNDILSSYPGRPMKY